MSAKNARKRLQRRRTVLWRAEPLEPRVLLSGSVVINEIHYDPNPKTDFVKFVELYNPGDAPVDLSGAAFTSGIQYTFPSGTSLPAGGYLVVSEDPAALGAKFGVSSLGPWGGSLSSSGDDLIIRDAAGNKLDEVNYGAGFPWPTVGNGDSIELINPNLDNNLAGNWRSETVSAARDVPLISAGSSWDYRKGTSEASSPTTAWRQPGFPEDASWSVAALAPIGYAAQVPMATPLSDMQQTGTNAGYMSVFMRKTFTVANPTPFSSLRLDAMWADGFNLWINGTWAAGQNMATQNPTYNQAANSPIQDNSFHVIDLSAYRNLLVAGTNTIAVQFHNGDPSASTEAFFDCSLIATVGGTDSGPTPGRQNSSLAANAPPDMRDLDANPAQPAEGQAETITVKVTDPDGVANVSLAYQLVDPGAYISYTDPAYRTNWTSVPMHDDGQNGDAVAGDGIYTVVLPPSIQVNRRLVRYRINASDALGGSITAPYADDPQSNFAYFVYDGNPAWTAALQPGVTAPVTFSAQLMNSIPNYTLIAKQADAENATWYANYQGSDYPWFGTVVYNGEVFDNVGFRARGGVWRYAMGKNAWKFNFNHDHDVSILDNYGNPLPDWGKVNLRPLIQQQNFWHRGEQGLFESTTLRLFQLAGVPSSNTAFVQLRIVDKQSQQGATQYTGDFWGLYLAVENYDSHFVNAHNLPSGNIYDMQPGDPGGGTLQGQGRTEPSDNSDLVAFTGTYISGPQTEQWWQNNLDLNEYYSYRSIIEAAHHYDVDQSAGKNYEYYHYPNIPGDPLSNHWLVMPWDTDLTWADNMYGGGNEPFKSRVLPLPDLGIAYKDRMREIRDLLYNPEQTGQLIDEVASKIYTPGQQSFVDADRFMWDYNPTMVDSSKHIVSSKAGQGYYYAGNPSAGITVPAPGGFPGMMQQMKNYILSRGAWIDQNIDFDPAIPLTPTASFIGTQGFPVDDLRFHTSPYASPSNVNNPFAHVEWRIAEISDPNNPIYKPTDPKLYEINAAWDSGPLNSVGDIQIPATAVTVGHTYRVRVRMEDSTGRWSHWSSPVQFIAQPGNSQLVQSLRVTELNYNPGPPPAGSPYQNDDFEFVELQNIGTTPLQLNGAGFTAGVTFTFGNQTLNPGQYVLVVKNQNAFESRYGTGFNIAGQYADRFSNAGEEVRLQAPGGQTILDFTYSPTWYPSTNGAGNTLVIRDPLGAVANWNVASGWRASTQPGGSPGAADPVAAQVVGRYVFYNHSVFDGNTAGVDALDDHAIATDKSALLPGGTATFANYTSFSRGLNGIMIDVTGLAGTPTAADFTFLVGNDVNLGTWAAAVAPTAIVLRRGQGAGGSDRIEIIWPDGAITNKWLEVTLRADAVTGLAAPDAFCFGNAIGESGNSPSDALVNSADELAARNDPHSFLNPASITNAHDYNRDGRVDAIDQLIARNNATTASTALVLLSIPAAPAAAPLSASAPPLLEKRSRAAAAPHKPMAAKLLSALLVTRANTKFPAAKTNTLSPPL